MPIEVHCPDCQALLRIADENVDRQSRCPSCSAVFTPGDVAASDPPAPPPAESPPPPTAPQSEPPSSLDLSNPYAPTRTEPAMVREGSSEWTPTQLNVEHVFSTTWAIFKANWMIACAAALIVGVINIGLQMSQSLLGQILEQVGNEAWIKLLGNIALIVGFGLLQMWLQIGQVLVMLDIARGREVNLGKLFAGAPYLVQWALAWLMVMIIIAAVAAVIVGIPVAIVSVTVQDANTTALTALIAGLVAVGPIAVLALMFSQVYMLIVDRRLDAVASLHTSYEITNGNKAMILLIGILLGLIGFGSAILGLLALCIGFIPAMIGYTAFSSLLFVVMYLIMTGQRIAVPQQHVTGPAV